MESNQLFRLCFGLLLLASIATSGYYRTRARKAGGGISRKDEPPMLIAVRVFLVLPLMALIAMFLLNIPREGFYPLNLPPGIRWLGLAIVAVAIPLMLWVLRSLGPNISETILTREGQQLVKNGPYRWVRHPLYSSASVFLLGLSLLADSLPMLLMTIIGFFVFYGIAGMEERELIRRFGDHYHCYRRTTGRLLPRLLASKESVDQNE